MSFVLLGFEQRSSIREFRFESIGTDHCRKPVAVLADLALARRYQIGIQELPLLCRELLEQSAPGALAVGAITLTDAHMASLRRANLQAIEEKAMRRVRLPVPVNAGKAWRGAGPAAPRSS